LLTLYIKVWAPVPAEAGEKLLPVTPGPLNVPPAGEAVSCTTLLFMQKDCTANWKSGAGGAKTVMEVVSLLPHPGRLYTML
jgi:hypothetical protein